MAGETALKWVDKKYSYLARLNDKIWGFAEVGLQEYRSAKLLEDELEKAGFTVTRGVAGMPTAFYASWGSGHPRIGFLAEYDALPHLSQKVSADRDPVKVDAPGHGCGHNTYGVAVLGAVLALQEEMKKDALQGTIVFYGCPAEETGVGKVFMARAGVFDDLDCSLTWHPGAVNTITMSSSNAVDSVKWTFYGRSAHAAGNPDQGRSALDAVELMNIGVNYLREHVLQDARIHYVTTKGGGEPNVVPAEAQVWYYIRAPRRQDVDELHARITKIAQGAALMTETTYKEELLAGVHNYIPNEVLSNLLYDSMKRIGAPKWSTQDIEFATALTKTFTPGQKEAVISGRYAAAGLMDKCLHDDVMPIPDKGTIMKGSSDVSDVSWVTPTAQFSTACEALGTAGHSWQFVATSGMSIAHKGLALAAKTLAMTASELLRHPEIVNQAQAEHKATLGGRKYRCAVPPEVMPPLDQLPKQH